MSPVECHEVVLDNGNTLAVEFEVRVWVGVEEYEGHDVVCGYGRPSPCLEVVDVLVRRARDSRQGKDTARLGCLTPCSGTAEDSELDRRDVAAPGAEGCCLDGRGHGSCDPYLAAVLWVLRVRACIWRRVVVGQMLPVKDVVKPGDKRRRLHRGQVTREERADGSNEIHFWLGRELLDGSRDDENEGVMFLEMSGDVKSKMTSQ